MTATERKRAERARRKAAGEVRLEIWAPAALHQRIREAAQQIIATAKSPPKWERMDVIWPGENRVRIDVWRDGAWHAVPGVDLAASAELIKYGGTGAMSIRIVEAMDIETQCTGRARWVIYRKMGETSIDLAYEEFHAPAGAILRLRPSDGPLGEEIVE